MSRPPSTASASRALILDVRLPPRARDHSLVRENHGFLHLLPCAPCLNSPSEDSTMLSLRVLLRCIQMPIWRLGPQPSSVAPHHGSHVNSGSNSRSARAISCTLFVRTRKVTLRHYLYGRQPMTTKRNSAKSKTKSRRKGRPRGTTVRRWVRERLKRIRDEEGMTQDDMAGRIEISTQKYGEIERRSDARCDHQTAKKIASVLGVTVSDLRSNQRHRLDVHQAAINSPTPAGQDDCRDSLFPDPIIERFLASYYTEDVLRRGCLEKFSVQVGELSRTTSVATKPHWLRFAWKLDAPTEQCNYVGEHHRLRDYKDILSASS